LGLLTSKPVLYVCNVNEGDAATGNEFSRAVGAHAAREAAGVVVISAKIEAEIAVLPSAERAEYLAAIGLKEPGLERLIGAGYELLHLVTFFTAGPKEARAWTVPRGTRAPHMLTTWRLAARPAHATPASCASRARTMSSPMATSSISGLQPSLTGAHRAPRCIDLRADSKPAGGAHASLRLRIALRCSLIRNTMSTNSARIRASSTPTTPLARPIIT
jgi:hypothetical protein